MFHPRLFPDYNSLCILAFTHLSSSEQFHESTWQFSVYNMLYVTFCFHCSVTDVFFMAVLCIIYRKRLKNARLEVVTTGEQSSVVFPRRTSLLHTSQFKMFSNLRLIRADSVPIHSLDSAPVSVHRFRANLIPGFSAIWIPVIKPNSVPRFRENSVPGIRFH